MNAAQLRVCNLNYLYELAKGDLSFVREMVQVFLEENGSEIDKLNNAIVDEDYHSVRQIAHKLRSSVPYVGLDQKIGDDLQDLEDQARRQTGMEKITRLFNKVKAVCSAAITELRALEV